MGGKGAKAKLDWNPGFGAQRTAAFDATQKYVDSSVLRLCSPYLPFRDGLLEKSGTLMTEIGSGEVVYDTPYAARLHYNPQYNFDKSKHAAAGGKWFENMKQDHADDIEAGARAKVGAKK